MNLLKTIFNKDKNIIIGAIHFPPLLGYPDFPGFDVALENALADLRAFEHGGVDGIIIENNYDIPHKSSVNPEVMASLVYLGERIKSATKLPLGISVLWNDYKTALSISKVLGLQFIRVPVFVDTVKTSYGIMEGNPDDVIHFRKSIQAEHVALFTDIHVKHSEIISKYTIVESAKQAIEKGSDVLMVTGRWTGEAPDLTELKDVRENINDFPVICGSGVDEHNILNLFKYANGAIVSTSLKDGDYKKDEVNIKAYSQRINSKKVADLVNKIKDIVVQTPQG